MDTFDYARRDRDSNRAIIILMTVLGTVILVGLILTKVLAHRM